MPTARRSALEVPPRTGADAPATTDDPFADLIDVAEATDIRHAASDDTATLRNLFGPAPAPTTVPVERRGSWPQHNYGPAYEAVRSARRPHRRPPAERHEAEVWDLDEALPAAAPTQRTSTTPSATATEPPAWPRRNLDEARTWLDSLTDDTPRATEAHLVATLRGDRPRAQPQILVDATDILVARHRLVAPIAPGPTWTERILRGVAIGFLVLFAVALLQLLLV